jgi:hypothetical protein
VEAEDRLCGAARDLIRSDGGGRAGIFTLAGGDWAGMVVTLPEGDLPAWPGLADSRTGDCAPIPPAAGSTMEGLAIECTCTS